MKNNRDVIDREITDKTTHQKAIRRNKLITQILYYSKDMETFASGLKKIKTLCTNAGVQYEFQKEAYGFTVVFYRHCGEGWGWSGSKESGQKDVQSDNGTLNGTLRPSENQQAHLRKLMIEPSHTRDFSRE